MTPIDLDAGVRSALGSIHGNRLVLLLGAGLSIPSGLPSAWTLADRAKRAYDGLKDPADPPLSPDIEVQADFFLRTGSLETFYIQHLIDKDAFAGRPNRGHLAVADFLLTGAVRAAVSTNYDILIEAAGLDLLGTVESALDGVETTLIHEGAPLIKIHGCWTKDRLRTVWTPSQLGGTGTVPDRLRSSANWLSVNLPNRDLVVVGFWSDWSYLNDVISQSLGRITPARVTIVDPSPAAALQAKAPGLFHIGNRAAAFHHVQRSGEEFFDALRERFSRGYIRRALHVGATAYTVNTGGIAPDPAWLDPTFNGNDALWRVRRDLEGRPPDQPAKSRQPPAGEALGLMMLELQQAGARPEGAYWRLNGHTLIRVINGSARTLHAMKSEYDKDMTPVTAPDVIIAVGAEDSPLPASIARPNPASSSPTSSVRGGHPRWLTRAGALADILP